jgi:carboxyl-terminal processing protease
VLKNDGTISLALRWIDSQLVVYDVRSDSRAFAAGIRKGFVINKINGKTADELYAEYKKNNPGFQLREEISRIRAANAQLSGAPESTVSLEIIDDENKSRVVEIKRVRAVFDNSLKFESRKLDRNTGYIKFNLFFGDLFSKFQSALSEMKDAESLIIDLRGNPGGVGQLASSIANLLSPAPGSLGDFVYRYETKPASYQGTAEKAYNGKIILLLDEFSGSTAEVFAGGLQENKRAVIVGASSAGAVLPSLVTLLPTGGGMQYVISNFQTPKGVVLEGRGVIPDINAKPTRRDLLDGRDTILDAALAKLKNTNQTN